MNPFDFTKAMTDFWSAQGQAFMQANLQAGEQATRAMAEGVQAMAAGGFPTLPEMPTDFSTGMAEMAQAGQSLMELWSSAIAMASGITKLSGEGDATVVATFQKMVEPRAWMAGTGEMDDVLGRMAEGPRLADLWEVERRYARVAQAWMTLRRAGFEHNAVVLQAWLRAGRRFTEAWGVRTKDAAVPADSRAALALWTETANEELVATQRSEAFLQTQAAMIRATTELRMAQQEMVEHFGRQYGFPTRTELDDVHRTVTELRREMRAMRREQLAREQKPAPAPAPVDHPTIAVRRRSRQSGAR